MNAISKEATAPNTLGKHSLLSDRQIESPPKRPKSAEGKTSANEQVSVVPQQFLKVRVVISCGYRFKGNASLGHGILNASIEN